VRRAGPQPLAELRQERGGEPTTFGLPDGPQSLIVHKKVHSLQPRRFGKAALLPSYMRVLYSAARSRPCSEVAFEWVCVQNLSASLSWGHITIDKDDWRVLAMTCSWPDLVIWRSCFRMRLRTFVAADGPKISQSLSVDSDENNHKTGTIKAGWV